MNFGGPSSYYELFEIGKMASSREIHEAYLRLKAAYSNDSLALYSLISPQERESALQEVEEAYAVLSDENKRSAYDLSLERELLAAPIDTPLDASVVSIDRVPPMEFGANEDLLIPPALDDSGFFRQGDASYRPAPDRTPTPPPRPVPLGPQSTAPDLKQLVAEEIEWRGALLKKIRELQGVSVEDLCAATKLSKTYLNAIETEDFSRLPAAVFVRGFVVQICKVLKLPHERAAAAYMARCYQARKDA
ncbi:MAG: hypothetical protein A2X94_00125 [Bdellovibrionales bacterium GWB1_55_8]|nr:MAG: hypothetical protein A2X94_00125 [Bdellovibrionales bacterium GWB1_55_8]